VAESWGFDVKGNCNRVGRHFFFESEQNIDEWGRTIEGAKGAYNIFLDTLNNGNWSGFFQNLQTAIKGSRDLYDALDRLGSVKSNNAAAIAIVQQQIAQLRLAKQNGQDVDAQIKEATAKLAALQKQSVNAGKTAGSKSAFSVIRNGVNSVGNVGLNDATINYAVDLIMKNGQSEFDKYKRNRDVLYQRGLVTKTETINDSQGGTYERQYKVFDLNALSREQQKQYALAQAITEGETRIQEGISIFAQAVQEGTSSAREEFKGNRYSLQGSGGGSRSGSGGGKGGGGVVDTVDKDDFSEMEEIVGLIALQRQKVKDLQEQIEHAPDETFITYMRGELQVAQEELDRLTGKTKTTGEAITQDLSAPLLQMSSILKQLNDELAHAETPEAYQNILADIKAINQEMENFKGNTGVTELNKSGKNADKSWRDASSAVQSVGSALQQIEDPGAKIAGLIGQAIANIALGFAQATANTPGGIFGWIAAIAGGMATMLSTISAIHSATGYAQGGIVDGRGGGFVGGMAYSGDNVGNVRLDSGELVLNRAQQSALATQLEGGGMQNLRLSTEIYGEHIRLVLNNNGRRTGKGEYIQTNFR
jgi:molecular chaperone GrpE (heat shock protein)